jgi:transcriptional regulator with XRE-family HTH domain
MSRTSASKTALPVAGRRALEVLGQNIAIARKRRRIPQQLLADRMLVSRQTVQRLEAGDPAVSLGVVASALFVLGFQKRLEELLSPDSDAMGISEDLARLPRRTHAPNDDLDF